MNPPPQGVAASRACLAFFRLGGWRGMGQMTMLPARCFFSGCRDSQNACERFQIGMGRGGARRRPHTAALFAPVHASGPARPMHRRAFCATAWTEGSRRVVFRRQWLRESRFSMPGPLPGSARGCQNMRFRPLASQNLPCCWFAGVPRCTKPQFPQPLPSENDAGRASRCEMRPPLAVRSCAPAFPHPCKGVFFTSVHHLSQAPPRFSHPCIRKLAVSSPDKPFD